MSPHFRLYPTPSPETPSSFWQHLEKPITGLLLTLALSLIANGWTSQQARSAEIPTAPAMSQSASPSRASLPDGTYLYGQSQRPQQIGAEYLVFEVTNNQVIGGFYMPSSSFDCFQGQVRAEALALTIIDSYDQTHHSYSVALESNTVATAAEAAIAPLNLAGFHRLTDLDDTDQQILATCKTNHLR